MAHQSIAISTFEQAAAAFGYRHIAPSLKFLQDTSLLQRLYDNFIFSLIRERAIKESKKPGAVKQEKKMDLAYRRRVKVTLPNPVFRQYYLPLFSLPRSAFALFARMVATSVFACLFDLAHAILTMKIKAAVTLSTPRKPEILT
jgi:hypothetical protein